MNINNVQEREFGWTDSSESDQSAEEYDGDLDMEASSNDDLDLHAPLARHGPVLRANPADLTIQREYWNNCAIAYLLDYRKFSVRHLQQIIDSAWRLRGQVMVVGRDSYYFILHFDVHDDLIYICDEGPWAVEGALLILERWRSNLVIRGLQLNYVSLWVQLHGLPLEYQYPDLAIQMGHMLGVYERIDWDMHIPRNIRFMRIRVRMNPWLPLVAGFMLRLDDGQRVWIQCRYERIHKVCTKCGLLGHTRPQCTYLMVDIEELLHRQRQRIQEEFQVQYGFDPLEPHFVNEIRAFYNRPQRWSTQIRFGPLAKDTGYRQRQHQQGGPPPPQPTMQSFMEAVQNDMPTINQDSLVSTHTVHEEPHPPQTNNIDDTNQPLNPGTHENTPSDSDHTLWQPPENSNLHWVWLDGDGPFLTNASLGHSPVQNNMPGLNFEINFETTGLADDSNIQSTTLVAQVEVHVNSTNNPDDSLHQRMHDVGFRFETGDSSRPNQEQMEDEALELHLAQFHIETTETMGCYNQSYPLCTDHHVHKPNNPDPASILHKPKSPGPQHQHLITTNPPPIHINQKTRLTHQTPSPTAQVNPNNLHSSPPQTQPPPISPGNPPPLIPLPDIPHSTTNTRKRFRKEVGRLGRNIRRRLFCGLFKRELTGKHADLDADSMLGFDEILDYTTAAPTPQDPTQDDGFWEADPNQLPQEP